jgi:uncharacterized membrane protein
MRGDGFHPIMSLLFLMLVGGAIGLVVVAFSRRRHVAPPVPSMPPAAPVAASLSPTHQAEAILAERLARSEISPDDYRAMLAALRESHTPA